MSLDVYLEADSPSVSPNGGSGIFIRRNGETVEISREEWDRAFPGQEPVVLTAEADANCTVYDRNITPACNGHGYEPDGMDAMSAMLKSPNQFNPFQD